MRFYFEPEPFTGMTDMMSVQSIGEWGDNYFVIEAESEAEATAKMLNLLEKRVLDGQIRPATEEESKEFEEEQDELVRIHERFGKGHKFPSGTEDQLIEDLQRVHRLFPNAQPDEDFYRAHGMYADAAWKEHFSRFNRFVGEAGLLPPSRQALYSSCRVVEILHQHRGEISKQDMELIHAEAGKLIELTKSYGLISEALAKMEEEEIADRGKRIVAAFHEEFGIQGSGNEQAT